MGKSIFLYFNHPIVLSNTHESGIKFTFSTNITNNLGFIKNAFRDALEEWCAQTQIAFFIDENDSSLTEVADADGVNLVTIQELTSAHGQASVVVSNDYVVPCPNGDGQLGGYVMSDIDIKVSPEGVANVSYDDMKNYFLHELGHCHMLQHAINPNVASTTDPLSQYTMYPDVTNINFNNNNGGPNLTIKNDDKLGAETIFQRSAAVLGIGNCEITPISTSSNCGDTNAVEEIDYLNNIKIVPNPTDGYFYIDLLDTDIKANKIRIVNILGKMVYQADCDSRFIRVNANFSTGSYVVLVFDGTRIFSQKLQIILGKPTRISRGPNKSAFSYKFNFGYDCPCDDCPKVDRLQNCNFLKFTFSQDEQVTGMYVSNNELGW